MAQDDRQNVIAEYQNRIHMQSNEADSEVMRRLPPVPQAFAPWWESSLRTPIRPSSEPIPITIESLIMRALDHSSQIKVFSDLPLIRQTAIIEADSTFDWTGFMESHWNQLSEPVGNTLTVGPGATRFRDNIWSYDAGIRQRNEVGGQFEIAQRLGFENNNSTFFQPNNQGTTRLTLGYTQPLMRGRGKVYNTSLVVLAKIDAGIAQEEFLRQLQSHLLEVTRAYWGLYLERGALLQKKQSYERAREILDKLNARRDVDAVDSQLVRVRAAVTERQAELYRASAAVKNAEDRIHALVNDPQLALVERLELIPDETPTREEIPAEMQQSLESALQHRPEVGQTVKQLKAAAIRLDMSKHELLPRLDAVLETYLSGLQGNSAIGQAWTDQFSVGEPSYSAGLVFEVPLYNRAAKVRHERRKLELRQLENQFTTTIETLMLEVRVAVREVKTSHEESQAKFHSMDAAREQLEHIRKRWEHLPGENGSVNLYLEDLLAAQERLAAAEFGYLKAQATYNLALMNLKRATGTLLIDEGISHGKACVDCLPTIVLDKLPTYHMNRTGSEGLPAPVLTDPAESTSWRSRDYR